MDHDQYQRVTHFAGLNGVRCFAAVAVVWHHALKPLPTSFFEHGHVGVDVFFVLSGFLISTLLIREKQRHGRISLKDFWIRRALRLFPAYFALLAFMACFYLVLRQGDESAARFFKGLPIYATYLSNWIQPNANSLSHTWTLATEEQFYLVWPLVEAFVRPIGIAVAWVAAVLVNQGLNFGLFDPALRAAGLMAEGRLEIAEVTYTPILLGVGLAHLLHSERGFAAVSKIAAWRGAGAVFAAAALAILAIDLPTLDGVPRLALHLLLTLFIAAIVLRPSGALTRFLDNGPFDYLGRISYGIYLYHLLILGFLIPMLGAYATALSFPIGLFVTIVVSAVSFKLFEQPLLKLGKRFRQVPLSWESDRKDDEAMAADTPPRPAPART